MVGRRLRGRLGAVLCALVLAAPALAETTARPQPHVGYFPTPQSVVDRMLEMAEVTADDYLIDLGSGDGRIPITAARRFGARALGVEIDAELVEAARVNATRAGVADRVEFRRQDLFETDISGASVLTLYLLGSINMKLRPRILSELKPGTRVVSHSFNMGDWKPDRTETVEGRTLHLWIVPERRGEARP